RRLCGRRGSRWDRCQTRGFYHRSGERTGMQKVKRYETVDCVVGGFRYVSYDHFTGGRFRHRTGKILHGYDSHDGILGDPFGDGDDREIRRRGEAVLHERVLSLSQRNAYRVVGHLGRNPERTERDRNTKNRAAREKQLHIERRISWSHRKVAGQLVGERRGRRLYREFQRARRWRNRRRRRGNRSNWIFRPD